MCFFHRRKGSAKGNEMEAIDISKTKGPRIVFWYFKKHFLNIFNNILDLYPELIFSLFFIWAF